MHGVFDGSFTGQSQGLDGVEGVGGLDQRRPDHAPVVVGRDRDLREVEGRGTPVSDQAPI